VYPGKYDYNLPNSLYENLTNLNILLRRGYEIGLDSLSIGE